MLGFCWLPQGVFLRSFSVSIRFKFGRRVWLYWWIVCFLFEFLSVTLLKVRELLKVCWCWYSILHCASPTPTLCCCPRVIDGWDDLIWVATIYAVCFGISSLLESLRVKQGVLWRSRGVKCLVRPTRDGSPSAERRRRESGMKGTRANQAAVLPQALVGFYLRTFSLGQGWVWVSWRWSMAKKVICAALGCEVSIFFLLYGNDGLLSYTPNHRPYRTLR